MTVPRTWTIRLAYDKLPLSLNDRSHWAKIWSAKKLLAGRVRSACIVQRIPRFDAIHVEMHWTPRTVRRRDADNAVATLKPALDGLRDAPPTWKNGQIVTPALPGIVADDTPDVLSWSMPVIHPPNPDPHFTERLSFIITERTPGL